MVPNGKLSQTEMRFQQDFERANKTRPLVKNSSKCLILTCILKYSSRQRRKHLQHFPQKVKIWDQCPDAVLFISVLPIMGCPLSLFEASWYRTLSEIGEITDLA